MISISGIWQHPQSTIPGVLAGAAGIAVAMGWMDTGTAAKLATVIGSILVTLIGALYKPKVQ